MDTKNMKKQLKKLAKKLHKKLENTQDYLKDQLHYLKVSGSNISSLTLKICKSLAIITLLLFCSFGGKLTHDLYIESQVGKQVVFLKSPKGAEHQGSATGFQVQAPSGKVYTLTNAHVCALGKDGIIMAEEKQHSGRFIPLRILEVYEDNDLCLVEGLPQYEGLKVADSIEVGQHGWSVGYPLGEDLNISSGRIKGFGIVQLLELDSKCDGKNQKKIKIQVLVFEVEVCQTNRSAAQTDVPTYPGNSGSPLVNIYGNVIGVMFATNRSTSWGSAVPLKAVQQFLKAY